MSKSREYTAPSPMTVEELMDALAAWQEETTSEDEYKRDGYFRMSDIARALGVSRNHALRLLHRARDMGYNIEVKRTLITGLDGRRYSVPVYRITAPSAEENDVR